MKIYDLFEAPITNIEVVGDDDIFDQHDRKILASSRFLERLTQSFRNVKQNIKVYFVNQKVNIYNFTEFGMIGDEDLKILNLTEIKEDPDAITLIVWGNEGSQKIPLTPWIVAHRFGHALYGRSASKKYLAYAHKFADLLDLIETHTGLAWQPIHHGIGTFKSARNERLLHKREIFQEVFAGYLTTGKIMLKQTLPYDTIGYALDEDYEEIVEDAYYDFISGLPDDFEKILDDAKGKVWVV